jgi:hypothetical protein
LKEMAAKIEKVKPAFLFWLSLGTFWQTLVLQKFKFVVVAHPPFNPDLTPFVYHLFAPLKEALRSWRFT